MFKVEAKQYLCIIMHTFRIKKDEQAIVKLVHELKKNIDITSMHVSESNWLVWFTLGCTTDNNDRYIIIHVSLYNKNKVFYRY